MLWTALACLLIVVVAFKYLRSFAARCPQCGVRRQDAELPLCPHCSWIYEVPGEEDEDFIGAEEDREF